MRIKNVHYYYYYYYIMLLNLIDFASKYKMVNKKLISTRQYYSRVFPVILYCHMRSRIKRNESLYSVAIVPSDPLCSQIKHVKQARKWTKSWHSVATCIWPHVVAICRLQLKSITPMENTIFIVTESVEHIFKALLIILQKTLETTSSH